MRFPLVSEGELFSGPPPELPRQLVRKHKLEKAVKELGLAKLCERKWLVRWVDLLGEERLTKF